MPTIQQLVRKGRAVLVDKSKSPALDNSMPPYRMQEADPFRSASFFEMLCRVLSLLTSVGWQRSPSSPGHASCVLQWCRRDRRA
jgi:hypothetical protein